MTNVNTDTVIDIPDGVFLTKEEIIDLTKVSINTLNNWLKVYKPNGDEVDVGRQNRRSYSKSYLFRIFDELKRDDLISLVSDSDNLIKDEGKASNNLEYEQINTSVLQSLLLEKDKRISNLEDQIEILKSELLIKNEQIREANNLASRQQSLSMQQGQLFLESKKTKSGGLFSWLLGTKSRKVRNSAESENIG
ncbi:MAG: hypothetical protein AAGF07_03760 [Patescibacteria group bacterium]